MSIKVGIIGLDVWKEHIKSRIIKRHKIDVVAINDLYDTRTLAHLQSMTQYLER